MTLSLDAVFALLHIDPLRDGVQVVAAAQVAAPQPFAPLVPFVATRPLLVCGLADAAALQHAQAALLSCFPAEHGLRLATQGTVTESTVGVLAHAAPAADLCAYAAALPVLAAVRSFECLRQVTARLRAPDGCPWDREQTHESLKHSVLEETYEVLEALDSGNRDELCEELGDLMMQVLMHAQLAYEAGEFAIGEVLAGISGKLMRRHPHVFGDVQVNGSQEVLRNWQSIKQAEKKTNGDGAPPSLLGGVPVHLPALAYAQAMQERAARVGFMRPAPGIVDAIHQGIDATQQAQTHDDRLAAYGEVLFKLAMWGGWLDKQGLHISAEEALRMASQRCRARFVRVEELCRAQNLDMGKLTVEQRERLWREAGEAKTTPR